MKAQHLQKGLYALQIVVFLLVSVMTFYLGAMSEFYYGVVPPLNEYENILEHVPDLCKNETTAVNLSICLNYWVSGWFAYKPTWDFTPMTFEKLKAEGGDCRDYTELYTSIGNQLGFYTKKIAYPTEKIYGHTFALIGDDEGYCILDQTNIWCFGLK